MSLFGIRKEKCGKGCLEPISGGGGGGGIDPIVFTCTGEYDPEIDAEKIVCNKTFDECLEIFNSGLIYAVYNTGGEIVQYPNVSYFESNVAYQLTFALWLGIGSPDDGVKCINYNKYKDGTVDIVSYIHSNE